MPAPIFWIDSAPTRPATSSSSPATTGARPNSSPARSTPACTCSPTSRWRSTPRASNRCGRRSPTPKPKGVLLYDIMTERHEITTMLQKAFSRIPAVFGELLRGSSGNPAVVKESVHHFSKLVSGRAGQAAGVVLRRRAAGRRASSTSRRISSTSCSGSAFPARSSISRETSGFSARNAGPPFISPAQFAQVTQLRGSSRISAQGRSTRRQPACVRQRRDRLPHQGRARESQGALEFRGARGRGRHALLRACGARKRTS